MSERQANSSQVRAIHYQERLIHTVYLMGRYIGYQHPAANGNIPPDNKTYKIGNKKSDSVQNHRQLFERVSGYEGGRKRDECYKNQEEYVQPDDCIVHLAHQPADVVVAHPINARDNKTESIGN